MASAVYRAEEIADLFAISTWLLYKTVKEGTCPVEPIKVGGRRLVWSKSAVDRLLGLEATS